MAQIPTHTQEGKPIQAAILPVSTTLLEQMFSLPEGNKIVGARLRHTPNGHPLIQFVLESETFPAYQDGVDMPEVKLDVRVEHFPDHPEYRRIVTDVQLVEQAG